MVAMLSVIDKKCGEHSLTAGGHTALMTLSARLQLLGGRECLDRGGREMLNDLPWHYGPLAQSLPTGDTKRIDHDLCIAIDHYLEKVAPPGKPLVHHE